MLTSLQGDRLYKMNSLVTLELNLEVSRMALKTRPFKRLEQALARASLGNQANKCRHSLQNSSLP